MLRLNASPMSFAPSDPILVAFVKKKGEKGYQTIIIILFVYVIIQLMTKLVIEVLLLMRLAISEAPLQPMLLPVKQVKKKSSPRFKLSVDYH